MDEECWGDPDALRYSHLKFVLCRVEYERHQAFLDTHYRECRGSKGNEGPDGRPTTDIATRGYVVIWRDTSVGSMIRLKCDCGYEEDITHDEHW